MKVLTSVIGDIAKFRNPQLALAAAALIVEAVSPFGINVGPSGTIVTAAVVGVGSAFAALEKLVP